MALKDGRGRSSPASPRADLKGAASENTSGGATPFLRRRYTKDLRGDDLAITGVPDKPWGAEIRGCLTAPEGYVLCGADMTSLEDTTKRHYMQPIDPDYVAEMSREGFDPHLDLAKYAGAVTQEDIDRHNSGEVSLKALRKNYKVVNYSATYGVTVDTSREASWALHCPCMRKCDGTTRYDRRYVARLEGDKILTVLEVQSKIVGKQLNS